LHFSSFPADFGLFYDGNDGKYAVLRTFITSAREPSTI